MSEETSLLFLVTVFLSHPPQVQGPEQFSPVATVGRPFGSFPVRPKVALVAALGLGSVCPLICQTERTSIPKGAPLPPLRPPSGHTAKLRLRRIAKQHEKRRERRRAETGVVIHYDRAAWKKLKQADRDAFAAAKLSHAFIGPRWDFQRDFPDYTGAQDAGDHLDHLFRFGSARSVRRELEARR